MDIQKTALRLPRDLHVKIIDASDKSGRSMNAEIVHRLEKSFTSGRFSDADREAIVNAVVSTLSIKEENRLETAEKLIGDSAKVIRACANNLPDSDKYALLVHADELDIFLNPDHEPTNP